ncbi:hypothetical protein ACTXT7_000629 [Hymenolepis weldensis]
MIKQENVSSSCTLTRNRLDPIFQGSSNWSDFRRKRIAALTKFNRLRGGATPVFMFTDPLPKNSDDGSFGKLHKSISIPCFMKKNSNSFEGRCLPTLIFNGEVAFPRLHPDITFCDHVLEDAKLR